MPASTETLVALAAALLCGGGVMALLAGSLMLVRSRRQGRQSYFRLRRQTILRAWRDILWGILLLGAAGLLWSFGAAAVGMLTPPTGTPAASPTLAASPPATPTRSAATPLTGAATAAPAPPTATRTPPPTASATAGPSPTPALPAALVTRPADNLSVTPPADARIAGLRLSRFNDCASERGVSATFTPLPKPLYALFYYDAWLPGVEWSNVWLHNGAPVLVETLVWDGSTGGCGFADYDAGGQDWPEGVYEVQIFIGERWLGSTTFTVYAQTPTPAAAP